MKYSLFYLFLLPLGESDVVARQLMNRHRRSYRITVDYAGIRLWDRFFFFRCAANRWDKVITEEQPDVQEDLSKFPDTDCGPYPETIDDLYLCASYKSFGDGLGGVVATAMPTIYRDNSLPLAGFIRFDADDIQLLKQFKTFRGTILHEFAHMLGLNNQVWEDLGITGSIDDDPPCPYSLNSSATREWQSISGCNDGAPTETSFPGSPGRQCSHWDETCMREELMTPTVEGDLHLSRITIGALEDIGYQVDYSEADVYTAENLSPSCLCSANGISSRSLRQSEASGKKLYKSKFLDEDLEKAMAYGRSIIEQYGMSFTEATGNSTGTEDKLTGGRSVVVYYMNANWEILSVTVTN